MEIYKRLLNKRLIIQLIILFFGLLLSTFLETLSFGTVIAFLAVITEPELIFNKVNIQFVKNFLIKYNQEQLLIPKIGSWRFLCWNLLLSSKK